MNNKQRRTLGAVFADPVQPTIKWSDIESLLGALGAEINQGKGSRIRVSLNETRRVFHRPHPENTAGKGRIRDVRNFLINAGVTNDNNNI